MNNKLFWEVEVVAMAVEEIERGGSNERGVGMEREEERECKWVKCMNKRSKN